MSTATRTRPKPRRTARVVAPRWRSAAPVQERSRETMDRFAEAAEQLLRERAFEAITVQDIVKLAHRPIGSFYARFKSKEALMPHLYQRYHDGLAPLFDARLAAVPWDHLNFRDACAHMTDVLLAMYTDRRWLLRAMALFARQHPEALPPGLVGQRQALYARAGDILLRHRARIAHADPEQAVRFALFLVSAVARDKLLFPDAPHASATPMEDGALRDELAHTLFSYLGSKRA
jgi:AcrR family transcriptional regulator